VDSPLNAGVDANTLAVVTRNAVLVLWVGTTECEVEEKLG
jgi:hypothetical protein